MKRIVCFMMSFLLLVMSVPMEGLAGSVSGNESMEKELEGGHLNTNSDAVESGMVPDEISEEKRVLEISEQKDSKSDVEDSQSPQLKECKELVNVLDNTAQNVDVDIAKETLDNVASSELTYGDFTYMVSETKATITGYTGTGGNIVIPDVIEDYTVIRIGSYAFDGMSYITGVTLPANLESMGYYVFRGTCISDITIPKTLIECSYSFSGATQLKEVTFQSGMKEIPAYVLAGSNVTKVRIPESVTTINNDAFYDCDALKGTESINLPNNVEKIDEKAFYGCDGLEEIELPEGLNTIGDSAFEKCYSLKKITFPNGLENIGESAFCECSALEGELKFPENIRIIGNSAFSGCCGITDIILPKELDYLGYCVFENTSITKITIPTTISRCGINYIDDKRYPTYFNRKSQGPLSGMEKLQEISFVEGIIQLPDSLFQGCGITCPIVIPKTVEVIGNGTFSWCTNLDLHFEDESNLKIIGDAAFERTSLTTNFQIPENITRIGKKAFYYSWVLPENVVIPKTIEYIGCYAFESRWKSEIITFPKTIGDCEIDFNESINYYYGENIVTSGPFTSSNLNFVIFEDGTEIIPKGLFAGYETNQFISAGGVYIPASVREIQQEAFGGLCLDDIYYQGTEEQWKGIQIEGEGKYDGNRILSCVPLYYNSSCITYLAGKLEGIDILDFTVTIDGNTYTASEEFAMNIPQEILSENESKAVVCTLSYGEITQMEKVEDIIEPQISISVGNDITYQDGEFAEDSRDIQLLIRCGVKKPYNISVLNNLSDIGVNVDKLELSVPKGILNLGESGLINNNAITEIEEDVNQRVLVGSSFAYDFTVNLEGNYSPPAYAKTELDINAIVTIDGEEVNYSRKLPIINLDFQKQRAEEKKAQRETTLKIAKAKKELQTLCNGNTLALSADLSYYLDSAQIEQVEEYLYVWLAEVNNANTYTDDSKINKKIMEKLGINPNVGFLWKTTKADTRVVIGTVYGQKTIEFTLTLGTLQSNGTSYGAFGDMQYEILEKDGIPKNIPTEGVLGISTYASMDNFIQCLQDVADSSVKKVYSEMWGKHVNEIASIIVDDTIMKVIDKKYSFFTNGVYTIATNPTKSYIKKMKVACPVDVYIYDMDDNLCGAIVDNVVDSSYSDIAMYVEDDVKTFYLTGDNYKLKLVGNGTGTMTYTIQELGDEMVNLRTVEFQDIPLEDGKAYTGVVVETPYIDNVLYVLENQNGEKIFADTDTYQDNLIKRVYVSDVSLNLTNKILEIGDSVQLNASIMPENVSNPKVEWKSSDTSVVTVDDDGKVNAIGKGSASVVVITDDGQFEDTCEVIVKAQAVENGDNFEDEKQYQENGDTTKNNSDKESNNINSNSQNDKTDYGSGDSNSSNENENSIITNQPNSIKVTNLSIIAPSKKLAAGKKVKLSVEVTPANATNGTVTWKTSNSKYATIDSNGKLTLKKAGAGKTVTVTATTTDGSGVQATCKIKIMKHAVKSIKLSATSKSVKAGKSIKVKAVIKTTGKRVNKTLKWTSSNTKYATVTKSGKVKTKKAGKGKTVKITAQATDGTGKKATIKIKIK